MKQITGKTKLTGLLGSPVAHSISPMMHNEGFQQLNLDYTYLAFDVALEQLPTVVEALRAMNVRGFNLTMPHKNTMCALCDSLSPAAEIIGAVNTVVNENGRFIGHNTDGIGYMRALKEDGYDIVGKKMTILGAGGAATAICVQAALDGVASIDVFKRKNNTFPQTSLFCEKVSKETGCQIHLYDIADEKQLSDSIASSSILTNATNVGMAPNINQSILTDSSALHKNLVVSDIIYNPRETLLMKQAKEAGCACFNGMYMLLFQGAAAFRCWTGQDMPVDIIKKKYFTDERI